MSAGMAQSVSFQARTSGFQYTTDLTAANTATL